MDEQRKREELIGAHVNMRVHLYRIIDGLTEEILLKEISDEENYPHVLSIIAHIGIAETYWFHKANHDIGPKFSIETFEEVRVKLEDNTERIKRVVETCSQDQLRIIPPSEERGPSVAWCILRTYQHGLYHSGQISKIRHMIDAPLLQILLILGVLLWILSLNFFANYGANSKIICR
ncbi:MAG: DinB family protein [Candidatus Thorarchaeota archaeon]|nr:MAG: DinB family protein [Candidatus Thorarchaeota archaeon]